MHHVCSEAENHCSEKTFFTIQLNYSCAFFFLLTMNMLLFEYNNKTKFKLNAEIPILAFRPCLLGVLQRIPVFLSQLIRGPF